VTVAWHAYQQLRSMYQADTAAEGKRIAEQVIGSFGDCPIPEVARLGRTLKMWRDHVLARFESHRISNGGTEAVNLLIEKTRRLAHGFRNFEHYRIRILLAASGTRPYRRLPTHAQFRRAGIRRRHQAVDARGCSAPGPPNRPWRDRGPRGGATALAQATTIPGVHLQLTRSAPRQAAV